MNRFLLLLCLLGAHGLSAQPMSWITPCSEQTFCVYQNTCTNGDVFLVEKAVAHSCGSSLINYSYKIDLNNDNVVDIQSSLDTVSGVFPKGTHKITWKATDNCGNLLQCTYLFHVKDCQPPNLLCINGLTQSLQPPDCALTFVPSQFILSLTDNCSPASQIKLGIRKSGDGMGFPTDTSITYNHCDKGFNSLEVWAKDVNGLLNTCNNYVIIQDPNDDCYCNNDADLYLEGCARSGGNKKISNFKLKTTVESLPGSPTPFLQNFSQMIHDSCYSGHISAIPFGDSYKATVRAEQRVGPLVGVSTLDLVLISKHILALEPFTSVYQTVAADVNKSNSVTTFDIVELRKLILGIYDTLPLVPAWRFTRPVADPSQIANFNALKDTYQITLTNLTDDVTLPNLHFVGIKYGDVNGSASFNAPLVAGDRYNAPPLLLHTNDQWLEEGETAEVVWRFSEAASLEGWQIALEADAGKLEIMQVEGLPGDQFSLRNNTLRALWADGQVKTFDKDAPVFVLKIKALSPGYLSEALRLKPDVLRSETYAAVSGNAVERRKLLLHFWEKTGANATFFPPKPNPFSTEAVFDVLLKNASAATLEVFDLNGRRLYAETRELESGLQTLRLPAAVLPKSGVFAYRLSAGGAVSCGRLVKI